MIMSSRGRHSKADISSIKYSWIPPDEQVFKTNTICSNRDAYAQPSVPRTKNEPQSEAKFSLGRVSTSQLRAAAAGIWDYVGQPAVFHTNTDIKYDIIGQTEKNLCSPLNQIKHKSRSRFSSTAKSNFEDLKTLKKVFLLSSCSWSFNHLSIQGDPHAHIDSSSDLTNNREIKTDESDGRNEISTVGEKSPVADSSSVQSTENPNSLHATYSLQQLKNTKEAIISLRNPSSGLNSDYSIQCSTSVDCALGQRQLTADSCSMVSESSMEVSGPEVHNGHESDKGLSQGVGPIEESHANNWLSIQDKLQEAFACNRHALSGALAGTLVSLSLHPVDTVKTIIQSNGMGQNSFYDIFRTVVAEKGVLGLYRGIASNIASSAPISAIYTYTYESVKGALEPSLPKEYHSFAHCISGGCSSIATSFIYTPSERIKQQMQVGSQYQNCWNALIGCLGKGGVPSLYAGWGAVLCRNIPHSVIKFYTYERLKQFFLRSARSDATSLSTLQTLVCGGLAGSTAALFTTPFDVVKTRLQTQAPGSLTKYSGVLHALREIAREEGLQGLYRGLTPRLAMYVSQGAIFFASYEFLKAVFSLGTPAPPIIVIEEKKTRMKTLHTQT